MRAFTESYQCIDKDNCELYKNGKDFVNTGARDALDAVTKSNEPRAKTSLIVSFTGLELILKSILLALVPDKDKDKILSKNLSLRITKEQIDIKPSEATIGINEILKRVHKLDIDIPDEIYKSINHITNIRNEIVHYHTDKTIKEIHNAFIMIFELINSIIGDGQQTFWEEDIWKTLCSQADVHKRLLTGCCNSWQNINFKPNEYFSCINCHSPLLSINSNNSHFKISCKECNVIFDMASLIQRLKDSSSFFQTHQIISMLSVYLHLNKILNENIGPLISAQRDNVQVSWISDDDDIANFFYSLPKD